MKHWIPVKQGLPDGKTPIAAIVIRPDGHRYISIWEAGLDPSAVAWKTITHWGALDFPLMPPERTQADEDLDHAAAIYESVQNRESVQKQIAKGVALGRVLGRKQLASEALGLFDGGSQRLEMIAMELNGLNGAMGESLIRLLKLLVSNR